MIDAFLGSLTGLGQSGLFNLIGFTVALVIYAVFVWNFHRFIGKRDVFTWDTEKFARSGGFGKFGHLMAYLIKYLVAYPILVFVWFGVFAAFMFIFAPQFQIQQILVTSFALVTSVRICSYYKEELSIELAKLIPFAILATYLLQPVAVNLETGSKLFDLVSFVGDLAGFFVFSVAAEWVIRIAWSIKRHFAPHVHPELNVLERFGR